VADATPSARRRALLVLGAAALVGGCGSAAASPAKAKGSRTSARRTVTPSAAIREKCQPPEHGELRGSVPQKHVACGAADVALTIDDGPDPTWTPPVLALLARLDIRATFCVIGRQAAAHPTLVADVAAAGHQIANHTYTHRFLGTASPGRISTEIERATEAIATAAGGRRPRLFRTPGGEWSGAVLAECAAQGLRPLDWSVDPRDWSRPGTASIVKTLMTTTPGSIILEHDGGGDRSQTLEALTIALPRLLDSGYRFVLP
jgi:peptidoglycan-N-acetylglucosamine deacetylase